MGACAWSDMRGVGVAVPESSAEARGSELVVVSGVGSITFVRFGSGEAGSDGGSWVGAGVEADMVVGFRVGWEGGVGAVVKIVETRGGGISRGTR
jgi:hypothetical protein